MSNSSGTKPQFPPSSHLFDNICRLLRENGSLFAPVSSCQTALPRRSATSKSFPLWYFCSGRILLNNLIQIDLTSEEQNCAEEELSILVLLHLLLLPCLCQASGRFSVNPILHNHKNTFKAQPFNHYIGSITPG